MQGTIKPNQPKTGRTRDVLAVMGIDLLWSSLLVLLMILLYLLQITMGIGYEYVLETGADGEEMWRAIPPNLNFAAMAGAALVLPLLYWRLKRKKEIAAGAFSLRRLRPYAKGMSLLVLCYAGRGLLYAINGNLALSAAEGIEDALLAVAVGILMPIFGMLLSDGRIVGSLRGKGRSDEEIVRVIAWATLILGILTALLGVIKAYLDGMSIGMVGINEMLSMLISVAYAALCCRLYLISGSMLGRGVLQMASALFTPLQTQYSLWYFAADVVLLICLCAVLRSLKEKTGRCENGLT